MESTNTAFFRPRRPGPELWLEDAVFAQANSLVPTTEHVWQGASLPVGMGRPDLTVVEYDPTVNIMSHLTHFQREVLTYFRSVTRARIDTIASRLQFKVAETASELSELLDLGLLSKQGDSFSPVRLRCLPLREVVTVEVKVDKWRVAIQQAARNSVVATRSYVALPESVAVRVRSDPAFARLGIGIISVDKDGEVTITRRARRSRPIVWRYYYDIAASVGETVDSR